MTTEYRTVTGAVEGDGTTLHGQVTPFMSQTVIGDLRTNGFREQVAPGAFTKTLQERDIVLLFNHNADMPLARTSAGNLTLRAGENGLQMSATPVQTSYGKDLMALTKAGVIKGMSFGFQVTKDSWTDEAGNPASSATGINRTIHEVKLHEVSAVTFPAYGGDGQTSLSARDEVRAARGLVERMLDTIEDVRKDFTEAERKAAAKSGAAMPDGSFPIHDEEDLENAIKLAGNAKNPAAARAHIKARAKALGLSAKIPDTWNETNSVTDATDTRDYTDPDNANDETIQLQTNGFKALLHAGDQVPADIQAAIKVICDHLKSEAVSAGNVEPVDGGGITPPTHTEQNSEQDDAWVMAAQVAFREAQLRALNF